MYCVIINTCLILKIKIGLFYFPKVLYLSFFLPDPQEPRGRSQGSSPPKSGMSENSDDEFEDNLQNQVKVKQIHFKVNHQIY